MIYQREKERKREREKERKREREKVRKREREKERFTNFVFHPKRPRVILVWVLKYQKKFLFYSIVCWHVFRLKLVLFCQGLFLKNVGKSFENFCKRECVLRERKRQRESEIQKQSQRHRDRMSDRVRESVYEREIERERERAIEQSPRQKLSSFISDSLVRFQSTFKVRHKFWIFSLSRSDLTKVWPVHVSSRKFWKIENKVWIRKNWELDLWTNIFCDF